MNAERDEVRPLLRAGPVPMIHWKNGRACAGPPPAQVSAARAPIAHGMAVVSSAAAPSAPSPPKGDPADA